MVTSVARVPSRGGGGVAAWLFTSLLVLCMARPASTSTGEDRLTAAVLPSVVPAGVAGIAITVAGTNFHPDAGDDGADAPAIVCVFAGVDGPSAIVPARIVAGGGASCDVPFNPSPSGFVSVGLSGNGGVDAKFFRGGAGGEVLAFAAPGALRSVLGSRTWARGDAAHFAGADMAPRDALGRAAPGDAFPCGWRAMDGELGESPGTFVSTAVRVCETSPRFSGDAAATRRPFGYEPPPVRVAATLDATHARTHGSGGASSKDETEMGPSELGRDADADPETRSAAALGAASLALALAEPPLVTRVWPSSVAAEGGATVDIFVSVRGAFGDEPWASGGAWARIGATRVAARADGSDGDASAKGVSWRCVAPARAPSSRHAATVALAASPFGAERAGAEKLSLRSVSALAVAAKASPAFAFTAEHLLYGKRPASASTGRRDALAAAGHHATCILGALGVGLIDHSPDATAAFAFGRASPRERAWLDGAGPGGAGAATRGAYPAAGPSGGGGLVWVSGKELTVGACDFGFGFGDERRGYFLTASVLVSSALVACEAPALAAAGGAAATRVRVLDAAGAAAYQYLPDVSPGPGYAGTHPGVGVGPTPSAGWTVEAAPSTGPSRGGTTVTLSRLSGRNQGLSSSRQPSGPGAAKPSAGFEALAGAAGAGGCRFGPVAVAARDAEADGDGVAGGVVGGVSCVAPAGRPGRVAVAVVDSAPGAACDSGGYAAASGAWRRHRLDDWD